MDSKYSAFFSGSWVSLILGGSGLRAVSATAKPVSHQADKQLAAANKRRICISNAALGHEQTLGLDAQYAAVTVLHLATISNSDFLDFSWGKRHYSDFRAAPTRGLSELLASEGYPAHWRAEQSPVPSASA